MPCHCYLLKMDVKCYILNYFSQAYVRTYSASFSLDLLTSCNKLYVTPRPPQLSLPSSELMILCCSKKNRWWTLRLGLDTQTSTMVEWSVRSWEDKARYCRQYYLFFFFFVSYMNPFDVHVGLRKALRSVSRKTFEDRKSVVFLSIFNLIYIIRRE